MNMAQFYSPNNSLNKYENHMQLYTLRRKLEQIKTRNNNVVTQGNEAKQLPSRARGEFNKETYDQTRQMQLHTRSLKKITKKNSKPSSDDDKTVLHFRIEALGLSRKMNQKKIEEENALIGNRLTQINKKTPNKNSLLFQK